MENPNHAMKSNESLKTLDPSSTSSTDASRSSNAIRSHPSAPPPPRPSSKNECAICLDEMSKGDGKAVFTAECSHSFHFDCITANVKHGNRICPLCRTQWQQVPLFLDNRIPLAPPPPPPVPTLPPQMGFEDDELLPQTQAQAQNDNDGNHQPSGPPLDIKLLPQVSSVAKQVTLSDFAVLVHLKAGVVSDDETASRAPLDLVAVLDVSGSMDGPKMELLKNAVTFVIQNLGETDRLSVVTFSSTARRVFPLRLMSETGKQAAIRAVNSLVADGCTNIAEGLKIGARVIADRRCRNPVPVMMLLSDGQDNYTFSHFETRHRTDYESLIPSSGSRIPIHTFGFGSDHDAELMHTISRVSSGTFSFIETETVIRDAFAQCIGGLLSTVVLEQVVEIECVHEEGLKITSVKAGSYRNNVASDRRSATINVGDMYAEEERDFLVVLEIPTSESESMALVKVRCVYKDPVSRETILVESEELTIQRPEELNGEEIVVSIEVDRQRNRFLVSQAISEAKVLADGGDVRAAAELLRKSERDLSETVSARSGDSLCASLTTELRALQEKMTSRSRYQTSGRAYALSSMSANLAQRATSRYSPTVSGYSPTSPGYAPTEPGYSPGPAGYSMPQAYQTSAMARMVTRSQQLGVQNPTPSPAPRDRT